MADQDLGADSEDSENQALEVPAQTDDPSTNRGRAEAENLLDRLLYKGILPRYAFPTDVATFYVFDNNQSNHFRKYFEYAPSQGLTTALTQYAPGKHVWIDGRLWESGAIYSPIRGERPRAWENRRLYFECSQCQFARTVPRQEAQRGEVGDCPACGANQSFGPAKWWIRPPGFAHPSHVPPVTSPEDQPARSYATRAKLTTAAAADTSWIVLNERLKLYSTRQRLLVTNRGPRNEGYNYCTICGAIEPTAMPGGNTTGAHTRPVAGERDPNCPGGRTTSAIVLGTDFPSDILLISLNVDNPVALLPGVFATEVALRTVCEAVSDSAREMLGLEQGEIQAEFRPALTERGNSGLEAEIYLYDTLPGGAGFSPRAGEFGLDLFRNALQKLISCPANCDRSCYRCLRSYKNKFEHELLDRHLGAELINYLLSGQIPRLSDRRERSSTDRLFEDLCRQGISDLGIRRNPTIEVAGIGRVCAPIELVSGRGHHTIVTVSHPLTPQHIFERNLSEVKENSLSIEVFAADEIMVSRHLPFVTSSILDELS